VTRSWWMVIDLHTNCFSGSLEIQDRVCISERAQNAKWSPAGIAGASLLSSSRIGYHVRQNMKDSLWPKYSHSLPVLISDSCHFIHSVMQFDYNL
jgi:hypothetical protein